MASEKLALFPSSSSEYDMANFVCRKAISNSSTFDTTIWKKNIFAIVAAAKQGHY